MVLLGVTPSWHVAQWVSRAQPHHTLPSFLNLNGTLKYATGKNENISHLKPKKWAFRYCWSRSEYFQVSSCYKRCKISSCTKSARLSIFSKNGKWIELTRSYWWVFWGKFGPWFGILWSSWGIKPCGQFGFARPVFLHRWYWAGRLHAKAGFIPWKFRQNWEIKVTFKFILV